MAALTLQEWTWPVAFTFSALLIAIVLIIFLFFKYRDTTKKKNNLSIAIFLGFLVIFIIILLDFLDVVKPVGGSYIVDGKPLPGWIIIFLILAGIIGMYIHFIIKLSPLSEEKLLKIALQKILNFNRLQGIIGGEGDLSIPVRFFKVLESGESSLVKQESLTNTIAYFYLELGEKHKALIGLHTYKGYIVEYIHNPRTSEVKKIKKKQVALHQDIERSQIIDFFGAPGQQAQNKKQEQEE